VPPAGRAPFSFYVDDAAIGGNGSLANMDMYSGRIFLG
jgi:hypothetical protein